MEADKHQKTRSLRVIRREVMEGVSVEKTRVPVADEDAANSRSCLRSSEGKGSDEKERLEPKSGGHRKSSSKSEGRSRANGAAANKRKMPEVIESGSGLENSRHDLIRAATRGGGGSESQNFAKGKEGSGGGNKAEAEAAAADGHRGKGTGGSREGEEAAATRPGKRMKLKSSIISGSWADNVSAAEPAAAAAAAAARDRRGSRNSNYKGSRSLQTEQINNDEKKRSVRLTEGKNLKASKLSSKGENKSIREEDRQERWIGGGATAPPVVVHTGPDLDMERLGDTKGNRKGHVESRSYDHVHGQQLQRPSKDMHPGEEFLGHPSSRRGKLDGRHFTVNLKRSRNPTFMKPGGGGGAIGRGDLKRSRDRDREHEHEPVVTGAEDSKKRREVAPKPKRNKEDTNSSHSLKRQYEAQHHPVRDSSSIKPSPGYQDAMRENRPPRAVRDRVDRDRYKDGAAVQEVLNEGGGASAKQSSRGREEERRQQQHGGIYSSRRYGHTDIEDDSRHDRESKDRGIKAIDHRQHQHRGGEDVLLLSSSKPKPRRGLNIGRGLGRGPQFRRQLSKNIVAPQSRKGGGVAKRNIEYRGGGHSVVNIYKQLKRGAAVYGSDERGGGGGGRGNKGGHRDAYRSGDGRSLEANITLARAQRRTDETDVKDRHIMQLPKGAAAAERSDSVRRNPENLKSGKENDVYDYRSREIGRTDIRSPPRGHGPPPSSHNGTTQLVESGYYSSRRCSSKVVALSSQQEDKVEDAAAEESVDHHNRGSSRVSRSGGDRPSKTEGPGFQENGETAQKARHEEGENMANGRRSESEKTIHQQLGEAAAAAAAPPPTVTKSRDRELTNAVEEPDVPLGVIQGDLVDQHKSELNFQSDGANHVRNTKRRDKVEMREVEEVKTDKILKSGRHTHQDDREGKHTVIRESNNDDRKKDGAAELKNRAHHSDRGGPVEKVEEEKVAPRNGVESLRSRSVGRTREKKEDRANEVKLRSLGGRVGASDRKHDAFEYEHGHQRHQSSSRSRPRSSSSPKRQREGATRTRLSPSRKDHGKSSTSSLRRPERSHHHRKDWERYDKDRHTGVSTFDSRYRRFGGGTSGLGGYSPRRRRSEAAIKTPSPPPRSPDRRRQQQPTWDAIPPGMDNSMIAAISAAHQAAVQHALVTLASVAAPLVPSNMLISPAAATTASTTPVSAAAAAATVASSAIPTTVAPVIPSLLPQVVNPTVTAVTLTQATRPLRRLYVGNVPATVSDGELLEFMNAAMLSAGANHIPGTKPCINCTVNVEKNHAFAEFITPEDATAALAFDGVTLHGTTLKIRRPKDYLLQPNVGIESASGVPDMVSSCVLDSPRKVFVGGIPSSVTAEKMKEIVTAFGQLKAYHWEVDSTVQPSRAFAFLEYMDPEATLNACAGLSGMRLGTGFLTVVQATPDANPESASSSSPFYGVPEHAKALLEPPSRVLELQNLVTAEEVPGLSKQDVEELIEDVRMECSRFGNVKSTHMVQPPPCGSHSELETENLSPGRTDGAVVVNVLRAVVNVDYGNVPEPMQEDSPEDNNTEVNLAIEDAEETLMDDEMMMSRSPNGGGQNHGGLLDANPVTALSAAVDLPSGDEPPQDFGTCDEKNGSPNRESGGSVDSGVASLQRDDNDESKPSKDCCYSSISAANQLATGAPHTQELLQPDAVIQEDICGAGGGPELSSGSTADEAAAQVSTREWVAGHLGKIYVEFSREEAACQAAHSLHGRLFSGRKVAACYFPLKLYQRKFHKGLAPRTFQEKQALALAVQGHLTAHIKD